MFDEYRIESVGVRVGIKSFTNALTLSGSSKLWSAWDRNGAISLSTNDGNGPWTYGSAKYTSYSSSNSHLYHYTSLRPSGILESSGWFPTELDTVSTIEQHT